MTSSISTNGDVPIDKMRIHPIVVQKLHDLGLSTAADLVTECTQSMLKELGIGGVDIIDICSDLSKRGLELPN